MCIWLYVMVLHLSASQEALGDTHPQQALVTLASSATQAPAQPQQHETHPSSSSSQAVLVPSSSPLPPPPSPSPLPPTSVVRAPPSTPIARSGSGWPTSHAAATWSLAAAASCDGYFGSGWDERAALIADHAAPVRATREESLPRLRGADSRPWQVRDGSEAPLECFFNDAHPSAYCLLRRVAVVPSKVDVSWGNETLESVVGRKDEAELPVYRPGAFQVLVGADAAPGAGISPAHGKYLAKVRPASLAAPSCTVTSQARLHRRSKAQTTTC